MISQVTARFWENYHSLPISVQRLADEKYRLWLTQPQHSSLSFKRLKGLENLYSVRIGLRYRALAYRDDKIYTWVWIGSHADYDKLIQS